MVAIGKKAWLSFLVMSFNCGVLPAIKADTEQATIAIKAVVVTMFEHGELAGDRPGEFQFWIERFPLDRQLPFEMGQHPLRLSASGVLGICTGGGVTNATASIMALGLDPRFDLSAAYWVVAGIAGGDPKDLTIGSGAWSRYVIDGDLAFEVDAREIPEDWPYGMIPLGAHAPAAPGDDVTQGWTVDTSSFTLNADLADWAVATSKGVVLPTYPASRAFSKQFKGFAGALSEPGVMLGETLSASTYWHGERLSQWANDWVQVYSNPKMNFMTSNMEDSGTLTALHRLARIGRVDPERIMVLRTVSNYTQPPPGASAVWSATAEYPDSGLPALESAYRFGSAVVRAIVKNWSVYETALPKHNASAEP